MLVVTPHHRIPVPVDAEKFFLADTIALRHQFVIARIMVKHYCPTRAQPLNSPGYHYKPSIRSYALCGLVARGHGEWESILAMQWRVLLMLLAIF
jgi:hypothetical protein